MQSNLEPRLRSTGPFYSTWRCPCPSVAAPRKLDLFTKVCWFVCGRCGGSNHVISRGTGAGGWGGTGSTGGDNKPGVPTRKLHTTWDGTRWPFSTRPPGGRVSITCHFSPHVRGWQWLSNANDICVVERSEVPGHPELTTDYYRLCGSINHLVLRVLQRVSNFAARLRLFKIITIIIIPIMPVAFLQPPCWFIPHLRRAPSIPLRLPLWFD